ncbi:hypothetical protein DV451_003603 [Geotrichum candidum]|uniref:Cell cycle checkpoint protein RAD1 n=1 Tax=Geotrichum candidum TaxID=1173061 RepID=A0A9P5KSB6_GEOCN|nr:hypothetical protein DV451_003603 [Geotrichum candidum]
MTRGSDSDFVGFVFSALTTNTTHFYKVLRAIAPKPARGQANGPLDTAAAAGGDTFVLTTITADGIAFSVGDMHTGMGRLYLRRNLFSDYSYRPDKPPGYDDGDDDGDDDDGDEHASVTFKLSLDRLIICLQMFAVDAGGAAGNATNPAAGGAGVGAAAPEDASTCRMIYQGAGHPFLLVFRQPSTSLVTTCEFNTLDLDPTEPAEDDDNTGEDGALRMDLSNVALQLIIAGRVMADAVSELRAIDTEVLTLRAARASTPRFALLSHGKIGLSQFSFPEDTGGGTPLFERFMVNAPPAEEEEEGADPNPDVVVVNSYTFGQILKAQDAMALATRVSIRCDAHGYMSIQSMYELGTGTAIFIDFRFCALQDDDLTERLERLGYD